MSPYTFLETDQIRLLSVRRKDDGSLAGEFRAETTSTEDAESRHGSREKKSDFFAVSYVWGSRDDDQIVDVDGHQVTITRNAHNVLSLFCDWPQQRERKAWVWIDAVCINQEDLLEKSIQVPLMASIYGKAKRTVVWLGESSELTDQGMDLMRTLAMGKKGYPVPHSIVKSSVAWAGFEEIASRPWWRRAWTLQESVIPSDTVYYCGSKCLTAEEVRSAVLVLSSYSYTNAEFRLSKATWAPLWHRRRIYQWLGHQDEDDDFDGYMRKRPISERKLGQISLPALLAYQRHSLSTDPKDYLYSLLGCIKDKDKQLIGPPAYDSPTEEVYRNFVRSWVLAYQNLDIIAFAELFPRDTITQDATDQLPSWAPDWSARLEVTSEESNAVPLLVSQPNRSEIGSMLPPRFLRRAKREHYYWNNIKGQLPIYAAAAQLAMRVFFSKDMTRLQCTGVLIDSIDGLSTVNGDETIPVEPPTSSINLTEIDSTSAEHSEVATNIVASLCLGRADIYLQYELSVERPLAAANLSLRDAEADSDSEFRAWVKKNGDLRIRGITIYDALIREPPTTQADREQIQVEHADKGHSEDQELSRPPSSPSVSVDSDESEQPKEDEESTSHPFARKFRTATHREWMAKRLAVTNKGYVAMVPRTARKHDIVCVLFGCSVPMVLRHVDGGKLAVVGECYLHSFMEGKAVSSDYDTVEFTLV